MNIELYYDGKPYIGGVFNDEHVNVILKEVLKPYEPFKDKIEREGGKIVIKLSHSEILEDGIQWDSSPSKISKELDDEIRAAGIVK